MMLAKLRKRGVFMFFLLAALLMVLSLPLAAIAATPAVRIQAPLSASVGDTITAKVMLETSAGQKLAGVAVTLKWDPELLEPVGSPVVNKKLLGEPLVVRSDEKKGLTEITVASTGAASAFGERNALFATQQFKVRDKAKSVGKVRIGFTTDKNLSANGTRCISDEGKLDFAVITPASVQIN